MSDRKKVKLRVSYSIIIGLMIMIIITLFFPSQTPSTKTFKQKDISPIGEIKNNDVLEQKFVCEKDYHKVGILFANYNKIIDKGNLVIKVIDSNKKVQKQEVKLSSIIDNSYLYIAYPFKKGERYLVQLTVKDATDFITLYTTKAEIKNASLSYNGENQENNMALSFMSMKNNYFNIWYYLFGMSIMSCYVILIKYNRKGSI